MSITFWESLGWGSHFVEETKIRLWNKLHSIYLSDLLQSCLNRTHRIMFCDSKFRFGSHLSQNRPYDVFTTISTLNRKWKRYDVFQVSLQERKFNCSRFLYILIRDKHHSYLRLQCNRKCRLLLHLRPIIFVWRLVNYFCFLLRSYFRFRLRQHVLFAFVFRFFFFISCIQQFFV